MHAIGLATGSAINLTLDTGQKLADAINGAGALGLDAKRGTITIDGPALQSTLAAILPPDQSALFVSTLVALARDGLAVVQAFSPNDQWAGVPRATLKAEVDTSAEAAALIGLALGVSKGSTEADVGTFLSQKFPNVPASFSTGITARRLAQQPLAMDDPVSADLAKVTRLVHALTHAQWGPFQGKWWLWPVGFSIRLAHDDANVVADVLTLSGGAGIFAAALKTLATQGISAAVKLVAGAGVSVLGAIAFALGENIKLVNNTSGVSIECTWPWTGGFFFWAQGNPGGMPMVTQQNWRWCSKCMSLAFAGGIGPCAAGGNHDHSSSSDYPLVMDVPSAPGQHNWRWCSKCMSLSFAAWPGPCAAGGNHDQRVSSDYTLVMDNPDAPGQHNWRYCIKCQALAFAGGAGNCAAGGDHDHTGSSDYSLVMN